MSFSVKLYGLIGHSIEHSFSPVMHNAVFKKLNIPGEYRLFEKSPQELDYFLDNLGKENIYGLNVTLPYKERALKYVRLDKESYYLKQIRAVNTIVREDKLLKGFNTDIFGFSKHLKELIDPLNKTAAVLGAGGASRAVTYVLAKSEAREIVIFDIDRGKAENVVVMIKELFPDFQISSVDAIEYLNIKEKDLLINATPVGLKAEDPCLIKKDMLHKDLFVYDLIYNPFETKLLSFAKAKGLRFSNGLNMLAYQGAQSFMYFTGVKIHIDEITRIMRQALNEKIMKIC